MVFMVHSTAWYLIMLQFILRCLVRKGRMQSNSLLVSGVPLVIPLTASARVLCYQRWGSVFCLRGLHLVSKETGSLSVGALQWTNNDPLALMKGQHSKCHSTCFIYTYQIGHLDCLVSNIPFKLLLFKGTLSVHSCCSAHTWYNTFFLNLSVTWSNLYPTFSCRWLTQTFHFLSNSFFFCFVFFSIYSNDISIITFCCQVDVGEWLYFRNMGAYTCSAASTFNGFNKPSKFYVISQSVWYVVALHYPVTLLILMHYWRWV